MGLRRRVVTAVLSAAVLSPLLVAAPAEAVSPLSRLRATFAASENATRAGYSVRLTPVGPAGSLDTTRFDRATHRVVLRADRPDEPTSRLVLTPRFDYDSDPAVYGDALALMGRPVRTAVRSPHNRFVFDDEAPTYARRLLADLTPSRGAKLVEVERTRSGTSYTYDETVDLVQARVVVRVVHGRVVRARVTQLAPSGVDGVALSYRAVRFGYGRQHIRVPRVFVTEAAVRPAMEELGLRSAVRFLVDDLVATVDGAAPPMTPADLYAYAVSRLPDYNRDTVAPYAITVTALPDGVRLDQLGPFTGTVLTRTVTIVDGKAVAA